MKSLRARLMLALYRAGRQAEALESYQDARAALSEELGLEPSDDLKQLEQAISPHDPALASPSAAGEAPPAASILVVPATLDGLAPLLSLASLLGPLIPRTS